MVERAVELNVAGQKCRVVTTADDEELALLAAMVEEKLAGVLKRGRPVTTQAVLLAAVALANDVREQRKRADAIAVKSKGTLRGMLSRVDEALAESEQVVERPSRKRRGKPRGSQRGSEGDAQSAQDDQ